MALTHTGTAQPVRMTTRHLLRAEPNAGLSFIRPESLNLGVNDVHDQFDMDPHVHPHYEIIVIDRGRYACHLNGVLLKLTAGDILVVKPGDTHADHVRKALRYFGVWFQLGPEREGRSQNIFAEGIAPRQQVFRAEKRVFWRLIDQLQQEATRIDHVSPHITEAMLQVFFWSLIRALPVEVLSPRFRRDSAREVFLVRLKSWFAQRRRTSFCLAEAAQAMNISPSTLSRRCRDLLGLAPSQAFLRYRMEWAQRLLTQSGMSVKEVSAELGFPNQFHFSRVFRKVHGVPPSKVSRAV